VAAVTSELGSHPMRKARKKKALLSKKMIFKQSELFTGDNILSYTAHSSFVMYQHLFVRVKLMMTTL
jgi:hypothetical protein